MSSRLQVKAGLGRDLEKDAEVAEVHSAYNIPEMDGTLISF